MSRRGNGYNFGGEKAEMLLERMRELRRRWKRQAARLSSASSPAPTTERQSNDR